LTERYTLTPTTRTEQSCTIDSDGLRNVCSVNLIPGSRTDEKLTNANTRYRSLHVNATGTETTGQIGKRIIQDSANRFTKISVSQILELISQVIGIAIVTTAT
jgi:hypothetical protein